LANLRHAHTAGTQGGRTGHSGPASEGEQVDHYETVRQRKDGTLLDISITVSPVKR